MAVSVRDVLIVGAGPSGLAAAIACRHHGLDYVVLEQGALVDAIARFPLNMVFFTTPELLEVGGVPLTTPYEKPTRAEALRYYRKVTDTFQLQISLFEQVTAVERDGDGDEAVFAVSTRSRLGAERVRQARAVVLAMGYYDRPNRLDVPGEDLPHVSHYYPRAAPVLSAPRASSSAARTRRARRRSTCTATAPRSRSCIAATRSATR